MWQGSPDTDSTALTPDRLTATPPQVATTCSDPRTPSPRSPTNDKPEHVTPLRYKTLRCSADATKHVADAINVLNYVPLYKRTAAHSVAVSTYRQWQEIEKLPAHARSEKQRRFAEEMGQIEGRYGLPNGEAYMLPGVAWALKAARKELCRMSPRGVTAHPLAVVPVPTLSAEALRDEEQMARRLALKRAREVEHVRPAWPVAVDGAHHRPAVFRIVLDRSASEPIAPRSHTSILNNSRLWADAAADLGAAPPPPRRVRSA